MSQILYIGFGDLMSKVESRLTGSSDVSFVEIMQLSSAVHENLLQSGDVFLIGPYTIEPVKQVQRSLHQNPLISIIVLIFPNQFDKIKQDIQLAYNVSRHITFVPYELGKDISTVFDNAVLRSRQRKSFARIEQHVFPRPQTANFSSDQLAAFLEHTPIAAMVFELAGKLITANYKARQLFYPVLQQKADANWAQLFPAASMLLPDIATLTKDIVLHETIQLGRFLVEISLSAIQMQDSQPQYLLLLNDITQKLKAENQLKHKVEELEFLNQELDEFINVVSHDFKTPLTSLSLLTELGMLETDPQQQALYFRQIRHSSDRLKDMLNGLNALVKMNQLKAEKVQQVNFEERLNKLLPEYATLISETGATIETHFEEVPSISYFTVHIDSLFSNLITNALKYKRVAVPPVITIKSTRAKEYVMLSFKDNGIGIDLSKNLNKLFQPFKRLTEHGTGVGLGLSIVKRMIERNQGYLEVFSRPGSGTEFKVYLVNQQEQF